MKLNLNPVTLNVKQNQRKLFAVTKAQLRVLLCPTEGGQISNTTFWRLCKKWALAEKLGMTPDEFRRTRVFYFDYYEKLKTVIGFTDNDLT